MIFFSNYIALSLIAFIKLSSLGFDDEPAVMFKVKGFTNSILLEWANVREASSYQITYSSSPSFENQLSEASSLTLYSIKGLKPSTVYYFKGRVLLHSKWSEWSEVKSFKTAAFSTTIGTYNILSSNYDNIFPANDWKTRKNELIKLIKQADNFPDVFGIQEGMDRGQVNEVASLLNASYDVHISKKEISARAIFWKKEKYDMVEFDDSIDILDHNVSGLKTSRFISHVRLKEKNTGKEILFFNIHAPADFSRNNEEVRALMADNLAKKAKLVSKTSGDIPVIILGDFNSLSKNSVQGKLTAAMVLLNNGFIDSYDVAVEKKNAYYGTHDRITTGITTSGENPDYGSGRIDYIFIYPERQFTVSHYEHIINFESHSASVLRTPIPSDHRPVKSTLHLFY